MSYNPMLPPGVSDEMMDREIDEDGDAIIDGPGNWFSEIEEEED